ncbi:isochorismatase family cysteine hydrolase [Lachnospiraceae bacterium 46-15]
MENKYLIVIDMQNDFVTGSLGTKEAQYIVPGVVRKVRDFQGKVIFTQDTHGEDYLSAQEGKFLPVKHCLIGSEGWQLIDDLKKFQEETGCLVYQKPVFGSLQLAQDVQEWHQEQPITEIELVGLCTDVCVVSNALLLKAALPEVPLCVDASCCAGITPKKHEAALDTMESCQIKIQR